MDQSKKPGFNNTHRLIAVVILAAALLVGISAYYGADSAKGTAGKLDSALDGASAGNYMLSIDGSAGQGALSSQGVANNASATAMAAGSVATGSGGEAQVPQPKAKEVTIDFLYADWCGHCQNMKPMVARAEAAYPKDRFEVRYWNEALRGSSFAVEAIYSEYTGKKYFQGYPTFVANGNDPRVGEMSEPEFKSWICGKFASPKPPACPG